LYGVAADHNVFLTSEIISRKVTRSKRKDRKEMDKVLE
jgi:hypothetical protein